MRPSVSVVVPTHQRRDAVVEALACVFEQTYPPLEVVVVDDGSTDGTGDALRGLHPAVAYWWQENAGASAARNAGVERARGEIVAFLDSDDRWHPSHLESLVGALERHENAVLAVTNPHPHVRTGEPGPVVDALPRLLSGLGLLGNPSQVAVRRGAFVAAGGFDEELVVGEDSELWVRVAAQGPIAVVEGSTAVRRRLPDSLQRRGSSAGLFPAAYQRLAESGLRVAERRPRAGDDVGSHAQAGRAWAGALVALAAGDAASAGDGLRVACRLAPRLSAFPELVLNRTVLASSPERRRWTFATAAALWPDPQSPTARRLEHEARRVPLLDDVELLRSWGVGEEGPPPEGGASRRARDLAVLGSASRLT